MDKENVAYIYNYLAIKKFSAFAAVQMDPEDTVLIQMKRNAVRSCLYAESQISNEHIQRTDRGCQR